MGETPSHAATRKARRILHADVPVQPSPSGLPTQHLVSGRDGATGLFVAQQWLRPGEQVRLHTHPVEEALTFLDGTGEATLGEATVGIGPGTSLYVPPGVVHGFRCLAGTLHVLVVFPVPHFAETEIVEGLGCQVSGLGELGATVDIRGSAHDPSYPSPVARTPTPET